MWLSGVSLDVSSVSCEGSGVNRVCIMASVTIEPGCIACENGLGGIDYGIGGVSATVGGVACGGVAPGDRLGSGEGTSH